MRIHIIGVMLLASCAFAQDAPWVAEARTVAGSVPPKLLEIVTAEMAKGGPEGAIAVCREKAPQLAKEASERTGWSIRRVSLRNRNPKAIPDAWERAAPEDFDRRAAGGEAPATLELFGIVTEGGQSVYRYIRALPTQPVCLNCHGPRESLSPAVVEQLRTLYPDDRATGYRPGEIRGAITIKKPA